MLALTFKKMGKEVFLLFEEDFYFFSNELPALEVYEFAGGFHEKTCYLSDLSLKSKETIKLDSSDVIHMRIDPPFDSRYQRYLWMLDFLGHFGVRVVNNPKGIMLHNEKLHAFKQKDNLIPSFVGTSMNGFMSFIMKMRDLNYKSIILKPLDSFSGIGVEKVELGDKYVKEIFKRKVEENTGAIICQPFIEEVTKGEIRALFYAGKELGSIIKIPQEGEYLANIAQGATFEKYILPSNIRSMCEEMAWELKAFDVPLLAFDILANSITEVNVTCPGLIVEVSHALGENLAEKIGKSF